ncbi:MAG: type II toxin-antitoxin system RatA family toxin [Hyphomicrobiales bacterium]
MPSKALSRTVPHSAGHMFDMVADIESYPDYLPGCRATRILSRDHTDGVEMLVSEMTLGHRLIGGPVRSRVRLDRQTHRIDVSYISGPLSELTCNWVFTDLAPGKSRVDFHISFGAKSRLLSLLVAAVFDITVDRLVVAFEKRADWLWARGG